jgi:ubiquinone biosynthesis protein Coq4
MNRNKLLNLFISNLATAIVHKVLERAIDKPEITEFYHKEVKNSWEIAKNYRAKINPANNALPVHDISELRAKIIIKAKAELNLRIAKGYTNIDISLVERFVDDSLKELGVV